MIRRATEGAGREPSHVNVLVTGSDSCSSQLSVSAAGSWVIIWLKQVIGMFKQCSLYGSKFIRPPPWQLSRLVYGADWAGFVADASQSAWQRVGKLPCLTWQGWELPSPAVRREHLCFWLDVCSATEQIVSPQPSAVTASVMVHGRSGMESRGKNVGWSEEV